MTGDNATRIREWQQYESWMVEKIQTTPLEEWHKHPDIMERVKKQGFDVAAAIVRRDARDRRAADSY